MVPFDLPLHAGILPRLLITIVGEPLPGGDRYRIGHFILFAGARLGPVVWLTVGYGGPEGGNLACRELLLCFGCCRAQIGLESSDCGRTVSLFEPFFLSRRFQVDFIKGPDVVFHFNPRFHEQTIVRNSSLGGCWGPEEREGGFPFAQGRRFEVKSSRQAENALVLHTSSDL